MKARIRFAPYLFIALLTLIGFFLYVHTFSPTTPIDFFNLAIPSVIPFFIIVFLIISCLSAYLFANSRRGLLVGLFFIGFLFLQYTQFNNIFYTATLILIFALIEYLFWKKM